MTSVTAPLTSGASVPGVRERVEGADLTAGDHTQVRPQRQEKVNELFHTFTLKFRLISFAKFYFS